MKNYESMNKKDFLKERATMNYWNLKENNRRDFRYRADKNIF